jgi:hypothetical protein
MTREELIAAVERLMTLIPEQNDRLYVGMRVAYRNVLTLLDEDVRA